MGNSEIVDAGLIASNSDLSCGDFIEAYYKGILVHRGEVTDIAPNHDLFWIMDLETGGRRLLDISEFEICKAARTQPACPSN
jgi:hypothetical protein